MRQGFGAVLAVMAGLALASAVAAAGAALAPAPVFPVTADSETFHGITVPDPYRGLEKGDDPAVTAWTDAQNARTHGYLDALPQRAAIACDLKRLEGQSASYGYLAAAGGRLFAMLRDPARPQAMLVSLPASADPAGRKIVLDPAAADPSGLTSIDWFVPSPDGAKVAVSLSRGGSEEGVLHILDTVTGREAEAPIAGVQYPTGGGHMAWAGDGQGFWYTRYPGADAPAEEQHFNLKVYFHRLGADAAHDPLVLGPADGVEREAEIFFDNRHGRPTAIALVQRGNSGAWSFYVLAPGKPAVRLSKYEDGVVYATQGADGAVYGISYRDAPNGKIVRLKPPFTPGGLARAPVIVPQGKAAIQSGGAESHLPDLTLNRSRLFVRRVLGGPQQVAVYSLAGKAVGRLPLPDPAANQEVIALPAGGVLFDAVTYLKPPYFARWTPTGKVLATGLRETAQVSFPDAEVRRVFAPGRDGTNIPITLVMKRGLKLDGSHPVLMYGYGALGVNGSPFFVGAVRRIWLDAGGIYAEANVRGGSEYGEAWHRAAMLTRKQTSFDDFADAARYLETAGYTSPGKMAVYGGSAGGLLVGAAITQHPELFRAAAISVGLFDMIRWRLDPNGVFTEPEFGSVNNLGEFKAMLAYSPYHNVRKGVAYPGVLLISGDNDNRVSPWQSRKFAAALQAASASPWPILLRTSRSAGHGFGSSVDEITAQRADQYAFLMDQLGMRYTARGACPAA